MTTHTLQHNGQLIPVQIKRSLRAKKIRLTFKVNERETILTLPPLASKRRGEAFLKEKEAWIKKQWDQLEMEKQKYSQHTYQTGDLFWYLGEKVLLEVKTSPRALDRRFTKRNCKITGDQLQVIISPNLSKDGQIKKVRDSLQQFYKQKASEVIHDRLEHLNEYYQFTYHRVSFRNQKTRWGSCSSKGNLNFNWRLLMAPIEIIDYVVVHELCHLKEMNHSKKFWNLVSQKVPDHKMHRKWLRENGQKLNI